MRRPFLFAVLAGSLVCAASTRCASASKSCTQRLDLLALPIYDITQFDVGALQERYFRLQPLDCIAVHIDSVTPSGTTKVRGAPAATNRNQTGGIPVFMASCKRSGKRWLCRKMSLKPLFYSSAAHFQTLQSNSRRRSQATVFTCRDRATRVRSRPLVCYGKIVTTGNIKTWPHRHRSLLKNIMDGRNRPAERGTRRRVDRRRNHSTWRRWGLSTATLVQRLHAALKTAWPDVHSSTSSACSALSNITEATNPTHRSEARPRLSLGEVSDGQRHSAGDRSQRHHVLLRSRRQGAPVRCRTTFRKSGSSTWKAAACVSSADS